MIHYVTHPTRHGLLQRLRQGEATVTELVQAIGGEQSNVSHHLRGLREAGLVRSRAEGRLRRYRLAEREVAALLEAVDEVGRRLDRVAFYAHLELPMDPAFHGYG